MTDLIWPKGVIQKRQRIQLSFMFEGVRCRELLPAGTVINKRSITYAKNKLDTIKTEIAENRFSYRDHFPESKNILKFEGVDADDIDRTIAEGVDLWLEVKAESCAPSTMEGYRGKAKHVKEYFPEHRRMRSLKIVDVTRFRNHLIDVEKLEIKTVNDVFTVLRGAFKIAKQDRIIKENILDSVENLKLDDSNHEQDNADPYTEKELTKIGELYSKGYQREQALNMFLFTCWTGLSLSEVMALSWEDVDTDSMTIKVQRALVESQFKVPKERCRVREFELLGPAMDIIRRQMSLTYVQKSFEIDVLRRNNKTTQKESVRFVFKNDNAESESGHFNKKSIHRIYMDILAQAKVRKRGPNQCRHTFASKLITKYVPLDVVATLLGHSSTDMVRKHYGRIIPEDRPNVAKLVSDIIGIDYEDPGQRGKIEALK